MTCGKNWHGKRGRTNLGLHLQKTNKSWEFNPKTARWFSTDRKCSTQRYKMRSRTELMPPFQSKSPEKKSSRLWMNSVISVVFYDDKIAAYRAVVLTTLLYGCESLTLYIRHTLKLHQFHLRCSRKIANTKWQEMIPNTSVLKRCQVSGIEACLMTAQFWWTGHTEYAKLPSGQTAAAQASIDAVWWWDWYQYPTSVLSRSQVKIKAQFTLAWLYH